MRLVLLAVVMIGFGGRVACQERLAIGDGRLRAEALGTGEDRYDLAMIRDGVRRPIGRYAVSVAPAGDGTLLVVQRTEAMGAATIDSAWVDRATLGPRRLVSRGPRGVTALDFGPARVTGYTADQQGARQEVNVPVEAPVFSASLAPWLTRALPLALGYEATARAYGDGLGLVEVRYRVVARESLVLSDGATRDAWRVETTVGPVRAVMWIDVGTRQELKTEATLPNGALFVQERVP